MDEVVDRLGRWLSANVPARFETLAPGATDEEIAAAEKELGVTFPAGMRALYRWRNGSSNRVHALVGNRLLMSLAEMVATRKTMNELAARGDFKTSNWWRKTWVPFLHNGAGDHVCWDPRGSFSGSPGQVLEFWHTDHDRKVLAPSFDGWLTALVDSLEAGLWRDDPDEGLIDDYRFEPFLAERFSGFPNKAIDGDGKRPRRPAPPPPLVDADPTRPVMPYAVSHKFEIADRLQHPQFGIGVVQRIDDGKCDVLFESGLRTLVHAKSASSGLGKPKPFDHTKGPRPI